VAGFSLSSSHFTSCRKIPLHLSIVGAILSKIQPFLHCHILQDIKIINSGAPAVFSCLFSLIAALWGQCLWGNQSNWGPTWFCIVALQEKVICCLISLKNTVVTCVGVQVHMPSSQPVRLFNLSCNNSHKNTLCLGWHFVFRTNLRTGWVGIVPVKALYAFYTE
jgi:hypothetical protein